MYRKWEDNKDTPAFSIPGLSDEEIKKYCFMLREGWRIHKNKKYVVRCLASKLYNEGLFGLKDTLQLVDAWNRCGGLK